MRSGSEAIAFIAALSNLAVGGTGYESTAQQTPTGKFCGPVGTEQIDGTSYEVFNCNVSGTLVFMTIDGASATVGYSENQARPQPETLFTGNRPFMHTLSRINGCEVITYTQQVSPRNTATEVCSTNANPPTRARGSNPRV